MAKRTPRTRIKRNQIKRRTNTTGSLHPKRKCQRNYYLHARLPFNKRYRIRTGSPISMESWIQHSSSMAEKPRKSEGRYITYGVKERHDLKRWILYTNRNLAAKNKDIFLCGISMGCATTLMAAGLDLPDNVKGIIADCGFTSPWDIIKHVAKERFHLPPFPLMYMVDLISEVVAGFGLKEVSIPEIMKRNKIPVLFIHGDADDYVPMWMTIKIMKPVQQRKNSILFQEQDTH